MKYETYQWLLIAWIAIGVITFFFLLKTTAPFGRHSSSKWGPMIDNRLGWFVMEFTVLMVFLFFFLQNTNSISLPVWLMAGFFCLHYVNRSIIFPSRLRTRGKKMPLIIMLSAVAFNLVNGAALGYYFSHYADYPSNWITDPRFILGTLLFFAGFYFNLQSDSILIHLRKPGETGYAIPRSGLFSYVSCPNHFAEMVEWLGYAILCWNLPALAFFIWTCANLIPRSLSHHKWYHSKFPDYPKERRAVIPFVV